MGESKPTQQLMSFSVCAAAVLTVACAGWLYEQWRLNVHLTETQNYVRSNLATIRAVVEGGMNQRLYVVAGLQSYVSVNHDITDEEFQAFSRSLLQKVRGVRSLTLIRDNRITDVYPREGNEDAIGLEILKDKAQRDEAVRAIESGRMWIAGPVKLVQGGSAFINRAPVYCSALRSDDNPKGYWGLVSALIRTETLVSEIKAAQATDVRCAIYRGPVARKLLVHGDARLSMIDDLHTEITLPSGDWHLIGRPENGWPTASPHAKFHGWMTLLAAVVVGAAVWYATCERYARLRDRQRILEAEMDARVAKERLDMALAHGGVGLWDWDLQTDEVQFSDSYLQQKRVSPEDEWTNRREQWENRLHPKDREAALRAVRDYLSGTSESYKSVFRFRCNDGKYRWFLSQGESERSEDGTAMRMMGVHVDVTSQVNAEQLLRSEKKLLSEERLQTNRILNALPAQIFLRDKSGRILRINDAVLKSLGKVREEVEGCLAQEVFPDDHHSYFPDDSGVVRTGEAKSSFEVRVGGRWVKRDTIPLTNEAGWIENILVMSTDITELKVAQAERDSIFELSPDMFCVLDRRGRFVETNSTWQEKLGHSDESLIESSFLDFAHPDDRDAAALTLRQVRLGEGVHTMEVRFPTGRGQYRWLDWSAMQNPVDDQQIFATARDVTERVEARQRLLALNSELKEVNEALTQSNKDLQQFAYVASHDLKTPLRGIAGFSRILQEGYSDQLGDEGRGFLQRIIAGTTLLNQLIEDLLSFARVHSQGRTFEETELNAVVDDVRALLSTELEARNAIFKADDLPIIKADRSQLTQLFLNLVGNAIKYCRKDIPTVEVSADTTESEWRISVADNGIGIPEESREQVFSIFRRLHTKEEFSGTGIGLAICRRIVERHGGRIRVTGSQGGGSVFTFSIPREPRDGTPSDPLVRKLRPKIHVTE